MSLSAALRAAGLQVTEHRVAGRPGTFAPTGVMLHHTAGAATGDAPSLGFVIRGSSSVPGPMYQVLVARSGHVHLISEGRANHAGTGSGLVSQGIPADQGNSRTWGIGVESPGRALDWPRAQWDATHTVARVLLARMGRGVDRVWRHRDYTPRKIDTLYPLADHRAAITAAAPPPTAPPPTAPPPEDDPVTPADIAAITASVTASLAPRIDAATAEAARATAEAARATAEAARATAEARGALGEALRGREGVDDALYLLRAPLDSLDAAALDRSELRAVGR